MFQRFSLAFEQLKSDTVVKLRKKAHELGIKNFGRMRKDELQKVILDALNAQSNNEAQGSDNVMPVLESNQKLIRFQLGGSYATKRDGYAKFTAKLIAFEEIRSKRAKGTRRIQMIKTSDSFRVSSEKIQITVANGLSTMSIRLSRFTLTNPSTRLYRPFLHTSLLSSLLKSITVTCSHSREKLQTSS